MEISDEDIAVLRTLEEDLWRRETRFDNEYMERLFAEDFLEYGRSGRIYSRRDCLSHEPQDIDAVLPLPKFEVRLLTPEVAQVTYESRVSCGGVEERGNRSSIWSRSGDSWVLRFHQGTPV